MTFDDITAAKPSRDSLRAAYDDLHAMLDRGAVREALAAWDALRRVTGTWSSLVYLRFSQDTANADYKAEREYADELGPVITEHDTRIKNRLLSLDAAPIEAQYGRHALDIWRNDVTTFDPAIAKDLEDEAKLDARYTELLASAKIEFDGKTLNLAGLTPYVESLDRDTRHRAAAARWAFFAEHGAELDEIYDRLVKLRHKMATTLGDANFIALGYRRMGRLDYGPEGVATYRREVLAHVVPLVAKLVERRRQDNGLDTLYAWDEALVDPKGNPKPDGDHDALVTKANEMFEAMDARLAGFYRQMNEGGFMDLKNRPTKAGGGFCTSFPAFGMPYIFANFNGTHHDVDVFTHEMGHAFQNYQSRAQPSMDYLWPTSESAEIHSMSLEFLAYPHIEPMFGEQTERYRRMHLIGALEFLPYGVCVDHFQHEVYAAPDATPAERHAMWRKLEQIYLPWRNWGDLAYPAKGGRWQGQMHIYGAPFYYIDYTLAQCCALQFWVKSQKDYRASFDTYVDLCGLGGSAPFGKLVEAAKLTSPFEPGALQAVVRTAEATLAV
ncbi:M3 family oligoendopeptidase [Acidiphilium sp. AL]|uniref:M3 family oligoendopeptidase n=1 Tax=Acidiphilium iwatense TaxID=768198 RepID=A0ABS9DVV3_9PROT|nr:MULTISPECIES: M3 family oligoendopeptidase [Acidiphilium]MCF3946883.1 M3 family oligoendopeptidase [Acidiphilium iwatense]MCU4161068.1 M3 family oligoendopeptidase [Acidiphilium sp. AL]